MKILTTLILIIIASICYSQEPQLAKPVLKLADSLYEAKSYRKALDNYRTAQRYDRANKTFKEKMDTCMYYVSLQQRESDRVLSVKQIINQLKEKGVELTFDSSGHPISYQNVGQEAKPISELRGSTLERVKEITQKDWEAAK